MISTLQPKPLLPSVIFSLLGLIACMVPPQGLLAQSSTVYKGTLAFPVQEEPVTILQHHERASAFEPSTEGTELKQEGAEFILIERPTETTEIEIFGPSIFRQRFSWPFENGVPAKNARFTLQSGASSVGTVSGNGMPITDVILGPIVPFQEAEDPVIEAAPFFVTQAKNGTFHLEGMYPNTTYQVYINAPGFEQDERLIRSGDAFDFRLQPSTTLLSGTVEGERSGKVLPNSQVRLQSTTSLFYRVVESDGEGRFEFPRVPADEYILIAVAPDKTIPSLNTRVSLGAEEQLTDLTLKAYEYARISGQVYDVETLKPIQGVEVVFGNDRAFTDQKGDFLLDEYVAPWPVMPLLFRNDYSFVPQAQQGASYPVYFSDSSDITGLYYTMQKQRSLYLSQEQAAGADSGTLVQLPALTVRTAEVEEKIVREVKFPAQQESIVPITRKGNWLVYGLADSTVSSLYQVAFDEESTTKSMAVSFGQGGELSGAFTFDLPTEEMPFPTGTLKLSHESVALFETSVVENGAFQLKLLPPGNYTVEFLRPDDEPWIEPFALEISHGSHEVISQVIPRGVDVPVLVEDEEGNPIAGVDLALYGRNNRDEQETINGTTSSTGEFLFKSIGQGAATLELRHDEYKPGSQKFTAKPGGEVLRVTLTPKAGIELTILASEDLLNRGSAYLMQQREELLPSGERQVISDSIGQFTSPGDSVYRLVPQQEGEFAVAFGAGNDWNISKPLTWRFDGKSQSVTLQVPSSSTVTVTCPQFSAENQKDWSLELVNTSLPENAAKTIFKSFAWKSQGAVFSDIPHGIYYLIADHTSTGAKTVTGIEVFSNNVSVPLELEGTTYDLFGVVINSSEKPVANAKVEVMSTMGEQLIDSTTTNAQGAFEVYVLDRKRDYNLVVQTEDQREVFLLSRFTGSELSREEVFTLKQRCTYMVQLPTGREIAYPLIFMAKDYTSSFTYTADDLKEPQLFHAGDYNVFLGEDEFGTLSVPECKADGKPIRISVQQK